MKTGLVLGKFYPFHKGHAALIDFARERCESLTVLVCGAESEKIPLETRLEWVMQHYSYDSGIRPIGIEYDESEFPNTSVPSREVSQTWARMLKAMYGHHDLVFSSEGYGEYFAEYFGAEHIAYDLERSNVPVSATMIRENPFKYWDFLPPVVQPYFVKKIAIVGTESTGKSTLAKRLADHFGTVNVPEMARSIVEKTVECAPEHLDQIAELHAKAILEAITSANKLLFVDTDINITRSYSRFLFGRELEVADWIEDANRFDLYLYLENDAGFVQDGTRLAQIDRDRLDAAHKGMFSERNISVVSIDGDWEAKFNRAVEVLVERFKIGL